MYMIMTELTVLIDNKKELVEHLNDILVEQLLQELQTIYDNTRKTISIHESNSKILKNFQDKLTQIPEWTKEDKQRLYQQIIQSSGITYLGDLIQGILGTQIKIIIKTENANLDIPKFQPELRVRMRLKAGGSGLSGNDYYNYRFTCALQIVNTAIKKSSYDIEKDISFLYSLKK